MATMVVLCFLQFILTLFTANDPFNDFRSATSRGCSGITKEEKGMHMEIQKLHGCSFLPVRNRTVALFYCMFNLISYLAFMGYYHRNDI